MKDTPTFRRQVKRLRPNRKADLDDAIHDVMEDLMIGEQKRGDLRERIKQVSKADRKGGSDV